MTEHNKPPEEEEGQSEEASTAVATTGPTAPVPRDIGKGAIFGGKPASFDEAWRFASMIANSNMAPKGFAGDPGSVMVAMQMGMELGLSPLASVQNIAVINGRPSLWGDALIAVCQSHQDFLKMSEWLEVDGEEMTAYCRVWRRGYDAHTASFSKSDATTAGLWGGNVWAKYPKRMLQNRARAFALRDRFADALRGIRSAEEERDIVVIGGEYVPDQVIGPEGQIAHDSAGVISAALDGQKEDTSEESGESSTTVHTQPDSSTAVHTPAPAVDKKAPGRPPNLEKFKGEIKESTDPKKFWHENRARFQSKLGPDQYKDLTVFADDLVFEKEHPEG